jgi:hypothetical protein
MLAIQNRICSILADLTSGRSDVCELEHKSSFWRQHLIRMTPSPHVENDPPPLVSQRLTPLFKQGFFRPFPRGRPRSGKLRYNHGRRRASSLAGARGLGEDSPQSLTYQLDLMRRIGFVEIDVLHKNSCFAAFGGRKAFKI